MVIKTTKGDSVRVRDGVQQAVDAGYVRQALERSGAGFDIFEINYMIEAIESRLRRGRKKGCK